MTHKIWWDMEGSAMRPLPNEDMEEFAKRISEIAWSNGQYTEREACIHACKEIYSAWVCESDDDVDYPNPNDCIRAIRARGEA